MGKADKKARAMKECADWNRDHPIGTHVVVTKDLGEKLETKTRSAAQVIPSGWTAVVWVEGIVGCYLLSRVKPIIEKGGGQDRRDNVGT